MKNEVQMLNCLDKWMDSFHTKESFAINIRNKKAILITSTNKYSYYNVEDYMLYRVLKGD